MKQEILITDFSKAVVEQESITTKKSERNKWKLLPYQSSLTEGVMLFAYSNDLPETVTVKLNATGKHDVYVAVLNAGTLDGLRVKLSSQPCYTAVEIT